MKFRKSSLSGPVGNCYELARPDADTFVLRNTRDEGNGPEFSFSLEGWQEICRSLTEGELGLGVFSAPVGRRVYWAEAEAVRRSIDEFVWTSRTDPSAGELVFTMAEHDAFLYAVFGEELTPSEDGGEMVAENLEGKERSHRVVDPAEHIAPESLRS